jgi:hypothetical protein
MEDPSRKGRISLRLGTTVLPISPHVHADNHSYTPQYAIHSHPKLHEEALSQEQIDNAVVAFEPREGEETLRTEDILSTIEKYGDEVSNGSRGAHGADSLIVTSFWCSGRCSLVVWSPVLHRTVL